MRTKFRVAGLIIALLVVAYWFFGGPNLGWTKTSVSHKQKDPVTELEVDVFENRFVPGLDFLAGGIAVAGLIAGCSFLVRNKGTASSEQCKECGHAHK